MRIQTKLISLLLLLSIIFVAGRYLYQAFENKRMYLLFKEDNKEKSIYFDKLVKLKGANLEAFAIDYTYWDEMADFIRNKDIAWAKTMMDENVLKTYRTDAIWVFNMDPSLVYSINSQYASGIKEFPLPAEVIKDIFLKERLCHFFVNTNAGLMEIRGATVHPTSDPARKTPPQGYFFAGRLWNKEYTDELEELTDGKVKITATKQGIPSPEVLLDTNSIMFSREFSDWKGKVAAYIYVTIKSKELESYKLFSRNAVIIFIGFLISVIIFITIFLDTSVSLPFVTISRALKTDNPGNLRGLEKDTSEFGDISRLISRFFEQRQELVKEIAERKRAEEEYRMILRTTIDGFWIVDMQGHFLDINDAYCHLIGYSRDELLKMSISDVEAAESPEETTKRIQKIMAVGGDRFETRHRRKDGKIVDVEISVNYMKEGDGRLFVFLRDITERKRIEEALQQSESYLKTIFNSVQIGMMIVDAETRQIFDVNPVVARLFGAPREQIVGNLCHKFICPAEEGKCPLIDLHQQVDNSERVLVRTNGERLPVIKTVVPITLKNRKYLLESFIDITERKKAEEELRNAYTRLEEMQDQLIQAEKLNAVGQLASGVAHEVRNPLGIILQGVNYLENRISTKEGDIFETLTALKDSVKKADKIINALLDFSRAASLDLRPEDVNSILEVSLTLLKARFNFENIDVMLETKKDIPMALVDKNKLEQVFINVLLNAVQAMPNGGKIIIRSYDKQLEELKNGIGKRAQDNFRIGERAVIVEIEDTGTGIPEENLKKIFDPFFTTKSPSGGSGLGLSVTRNIIHMHKGLIYAQSQIGKGTKITIILKITKRS